MITPFNYFFAGRCFEISLRNIGFSFLNIKGTFKDRNVQYFYGVYLLMISFRLMICSHLWFNCKIIVSHMYEPMGVCNLCSWPTDDLKGWGVVGIYKQFILSVADICVSPWGIAVNLKSKVFLVSWFIKILLYFSFVEIISSFISYIWEWVSPKH